jgi:AcrR family transcriptional regulator
MASTKRRSYNQVARAQTQQRTRDALLDAAVAEFYEGRWQQASLEAVARGAGVTKQTLLRHFGSKEELLLQALVRAYEQVRDQRWSVPQGDVAGTVDNLLDHYEAWGERALRIGAFQGSPAGLASLARAARRVHYEWVDYAFGPWLAQLRGKARVRCRAALIALCDVHTWWTLSNDLALSRREVRATLTNVIEGMLRSVSPRSGKSQEHG